MSRRKRQELLDDAEALLCWAGLAAAVVAFAGYPQAFAVTAAAIAVQAVRGRVR